MQAQVANHGTICQLPHVSGMLLRRTCFSASETDARAFLAHLVAVPAATGSTRKAQQRCRSGEDAETAASALNPVVPCRPSTVSTCRYSAKQRSLWSSCCRRVYRLEMRCPRRISSATENTTCWARIPAETACGVCVWSLCAAPAQQTALLSNDLSLCAQISKKREKS
jgi:hypothetical protein